MLQVTVKVRDSRIDVAENRNMDIDSEIASKFRDKANSDEKLVQQLHDCFLRFQWHREDLPYDESSERYYLIGQLRNRKLDINTVWRQLLCAPM